MTQRSKSKKPKGFDSWFEYDLVRNMPACSYHTSRIDYIQKKRYAPDFSYYKDGYTVYIEAKGRFRDNQEARKYIDVRSSLDDGDSLVFIFQNPDTPMPHSKKRSDGSKMTHGEWATKHGFEYYTISSLPLEWSKIL